MQCPYRHSSVQTSIPSTHHIPQQDNFKCAIEECHERRHKDPQGVVHECCCYTHAMEHMRRTEEGKLLDWLALVYALIVGYKIVRTHDPFHRGNRNFWGIGSICVVHGDGVTFMKVQYTCQNKVSILNLYSLLTIVGVMHFPFLYRNYTIAREKCMTVAIFSL